MSSESQRRRTNAIFGTFFMVAGAIVACLIFVDRWTEIRLPVPGVWYNLRGLHVLICIGLFVLGAWAHRLAAEDERSTKPVFQSLTVFSKPDCELCDEAMELLREFDVYLPPISVVDITGDTDLEAQHGLSIPVVQIDGQIRFRGIVSRELLQRLIDAEQRKQQTRDTSPASVS